MLPSFGTYFEGKSLPPNMPAANWSSVITAIRLWYRRRLRAERERLDSEIINRDYEQLNSEAQDVLEYQAPIGDFPDE